MRIGFITGVFDPVHIGHIGLARTMQSEYGLDKVLIFPEGKPWKKIPVASYAQRLDMLRLVWPDVVDLGDQKHTARLLMEYLQSNYEGDEYYYLLGKDVADTIKTWEESNILPNSVYLLIADRQPHHASSSAVRSGRLQDVDPIVVDYIVSNNLYRST
jgi:nicotinate-nucleotide adenylyltransferase